MSVTAVVLNLGLKSVRAIAFSEGGAKLSTASRPVQTVIRDEWVEQDPEEWWSLSVECLRDVVARTGGQPKFLTVTASSACLVPVGRGGIPLRRAIMVSDRRATSQAAAIGELEEFTELAAKSGAFTADPYFQLPKALWVRENEPKVWSETRHLLTPADFLLFRLCGEVATDPLNAEKYYWTKDGYPSSLLQRLGLSEALLPQVLPVGTRLGPVTQEASALTGISEGTEVVLTTYDAMCAFWGSGVSAEGDVADVSGTVTSVRALRASPIPPSESRVFSQPVEGTPYWVAGGSNNLGGGLVEWLRQTFYTGDELGYERLEREAGLSDPTAKGLVFLPYLLGERCPLWDIDARGVLFGLERHHSRGDIARAILEATAFSVQHILSTLASHNTAFTRMRVSGGLARIGLVNQIKADVTGLAVDVVAEFETTSLGGFILAGVGMGHFHSIAEGAALVRVREVVLPDPSNVELYREWFQLYLNTYTALRPLYRQRAMFKRRFFAATSDYLENL